jgi:hypothetical protein
MRLAWALRLPDPKGVQTHSKSSLGRAPTVCSQNNLSGFSTVDIMSYIRFSPETFEPGALLVPLILLQRQSPRLAYA